MTYWDYKFLDWLLSQLLNIYRTKKLIRLWITIQNKKMDLWFDLPSTKKGLSNYLWQEGV